MSRAPGTRRLCDVAGTAYFAIPGNLSLPTGGYGYDRRLIAGLPSLGWQVNTVPLPAGYPFPSHADRQATKDAFDSLPDDAIVLVDGLAFGAMDELAPALSARLRLVALVHHPLADETGLTAAQAEALKASERAALAHARAVVCTSGATARRLAAGFSVPPERITVALPGTDPKPRAPANGSPPVLLSVGALVPRKGHDVLIEALGHLRHLDWTARLVGADDRDPEWTRRLKSRAAGLGLAGRIAFAGAVADADAELASADVFVLPSRHEGYGMAYAEALAHGLPTIGCRAGAVPDVVPEAAGALVPPDDPSALAGAIARLLTDPEAHRRAADAAWAACQALPTWQDTAGIVVGLLERLR
ncbi:glycosyltransferase family 4 protein (plasmid) [Aquamicrobium terrae]